MKLILVGHLTIFVPVSSAEPSNNQSDFVQFLHKVALEKGIDVSNPVWLYGVSVILAGYGGKQLWNTFYTWYRTREIKDDIEILRSDSNQTPAHQRKIQRLSHCISRYGLLKQGGFGASLVGLGIGVAFLAKHRAHTEFGTDIKGVQIRQSANDQLSYQKLQRKILEGFSAEIAPQIKEVFWEYRLTILDNIKTSAAMAAFSDEAKPGVIQSIESVVLDQIVLEKRLDEVLASDIPAEIMRLSPSDKGSVGYLSQLLDRGKADPEDTQFKIFISHIERELVRGVIGSRLPYGTSSDFLTPATHKRLLDKIHEAALKSTVEKKASEITAR